MADIIQGPVTNIVDGDTFDMNVTQIGTNNQNKYNSTERIRIANFDAAEIGSVGGYRDKQRLTNAIAGKNARCIVQTRDTYGRVVADVKIL